MMYFTSCILVLCSVLGFCSQPLLGQTTTDSSVPTAPVDGVPSAAGILSALSSGTGSGSNTVNIDQNMLQSFISMLQSMFGGSQSGSLSGLSGTQMASLSQASQGSSSTSGFSGIGRKMMEQPLQGYSLLNVRKIDNLLRTGPGLSQCMSALQSGDEPKGVQLLKDTISQIDQAKTADSSLREGKQCAATRKALQVGETSQANGGGGVCPNFTNAVSAADGQSSPILLDLNGNGIADVTTPDHTGDRGAFVPEGSVRFDVSGQGRSARTEWLKPGEDGLLALDSNGNGLVDSASELFGDVDGFVDGYAKLALLDINHDGMLSGRELVNLSAWIDRNGDGACQSGELVRAADLGLTAISVNHQNYVSTFVRNGKTYQTWDWFPRSK